MLSARDSRPDPAPDLAPVLAGLLRRDGPALLARRRRLEGLLRDYAPAALRDIRLLLVAFDSGAAARIAGATEPFGAEALAREADAMAEAYGCERALALAAVETWDRGVMGSRGALPAPPSPAGCEGVGATDAAAEPMARFGRIGGIALAILLVVVALARWLGFL